MLTSATLAFVWAVIGFFALRFLLAGYFREPGRAAVASGAIALTFLATFFARSDVGTVPVATAASPNAAPTQVAQEVSELCVSGIHVTSGSLGSIDVAEQSGERLLSGGAVALPLKVHLAGWAFAGKTALAQGVCPAIDGLVVHPSAASYGIQRPDVATAFSNPGDVDSGYDIQVMKSSLRPGLHHFNVVAKSSDGSWKTIGRDFPFAVH